MTRILPHPLKNTVKAYRNLLAFLRFFPEGLFYTLSICLGFIICIAGTEGAPFANIERAFNVYLLIHFTLCFRVGLSIQNSAKIMTKMPWVLGVTLFFVGLFAKTFDASSAELIRLCVYMSYLVFVFFMLGAMMAALAEPIKSRPKPMAFWEKVLFVSFVVLGCLLIIFSESTGTHIAYTIKDMMGMVR